MPETALQNRTQSTQTVAPDAAGDAARRSQLAGLTYAQQAAAVAPGSAGANKPALGSGDQAFQEMWDAHPHNYQDDASQNTSSDEVREEHGLPAYLANTCAIRLSVMLNKIGQKITPASVKAAGITRAPTYSKKTKEYYIVAASEMWQYLTKHFRKSDVVFPQKGTYKTEAEFQEAYDSTIRPLVQGKKGIVAFQKIFGYGGTGHVDLFDGETLSDAGNWYPSTRIELWYISVP